MCRLTGRQGEEITGWGDHPGRVSQGLGFPHWRRFRTPCGVRSRLWALTTSNGYSRFFHSSLHRFVSVISSASIILLPKSMFSGSNFASVSVWSLSLRRERGWLLWRSVSLIGCGKCVCNSLFFSMAGLKQIKALFAGFTGSSCRHRGLTS